jgi:hypothetical protein
MHCGRILPSSALLRRVTRVKELRAIVADDGDERLPIDARASVIVLAAHFGAVQTLIGSDGGEPSALKNRTFVAGTPS